MKLKFLKANYKTEFKIPKEFTKTLKKTLKPNSIVAIYTAIQFIPNLPQIKKTIEKENFKTITSIPVRASFEGQILGCDSFEDSLNINTDEIDAFVYIGDGYFHPKALLLGQEHKKEIKPVIIANIPQQTIEVINKTHIQNYIKKKKGNLLKFYTSKTIGVFVTSKWGQEYKNSALKLKTMYPEKNFYYFAGDNFLEQEMENFAFVECWVNTACPRIGQDDITRHKKCVVNIKDIWQK